MSSPLLHVVCPACHSVNRIPQNRLADDPRCGKCKDSLLTGTPQDLDDQSFVRVVQRSDLLVIVDFWAPWCGPCRMMAPSFAAAARELASAVVLAKLNTEASPATANRFGIQGIPCLIAFRGGREVARQTGALNTAQIVAWARSLG